MSYPFDSCEKFMCVQPPGDLDLMQVIDWFRMRFRSEAGLRCRWSGDCTLSMQGTDNSLNWLHFRFTWSQGPLKILPMYIQTQNLWQGSGGRGQPGCTQVEHS